MSAPDPTTVREIAREQILNRAKDLAQEDERVYELVIEKDVCAQMAEEERWAFADDVMAEIGRARVTASWPDEQQPAEATGGEQAQDGAVEAVRRFARAWDYGNDIVHEDRYAPVVTLSIGEHTGGTASMTPPQLLAVLALLDDRGVMDLAERNEQLRDERDALAARVAELTAEREADTRAVAALIEAAVALNLGARLQPALGDLDDRFVDRIAALDADAGQDAHGATEAARESVQASQERSNSSATAAGLSEPEPCDGDCDCDCQPGQPCLCPERDCYCGPCPVCGDNLQRADNDTTEDDR